MARRHHTNKFPKEPSNIFTISPATLNVNSFEELTKDVIIYSRYNGEFLDFDIIQYPSFCNKIEKGLVDGQKRILTLTFDKNINFEKRSELLILKQNKSNIEINSNIIQSSAKSVFKSNKELINFSYSVSDEICLINSYLDTTYLDYDIISFPDWVEVIKKETTDLYSTLYINSVLNNTTDQLKGNIILKQHDSNNEITINLVKEASPPIFKSNLYSVLKDYSTETIILNINSTVGGIPTDYTILNIPSWFTIEKPDTILDPSEIKLNFTKNTSINLREANLKFVQYNSDSTFIVNVKQTGAIYDFSTDIINYNVSNKGESIIQNITSRLDDDFIDYTEYCSDLQWLQFSNKVEEKIGKLNINVNETYDINSRSNSIILTQLISNKKININITQDAADIIFESDYYEMDLELNEEKTLNIKSSLNQFFIGYIIGSSSKWLEVKKENIENSIYSKLNIKILDNLEKTGNIKLIQNTTNKIINLIINIK